MLPQKTRWVLPMSTSPPGRPATRGWCRPSCWTACLYLDGLRYGTEYLPRGQRPANVSWSPRPRKPRSVGFACGGPQGSADDPEEVGDPQYDAEILGMYVLPSHQRVGIGRRLMSGLIQRLAADDSSSAFVWCLAEAPAALFYQSMGGVLVRTKDELMGGVPVRVAGYGWTHLKHRLA